jgi:hypothetical protein
MENGKQILINKKNRNITLLKSLDQLRKTPPENPKEFLRVCYLYFDNFDNTLQLTNLPFY